MNKRILIIIAAIIIIILLCLLWPMQEANISTTLTEISSSSGGAKLYEEKDTATSVSFDECCSGTIEVEFRHGWSFYHDDWQPADGCCHSPVKWTLRDSAGQIVFANSESCPTSKTEVIKSGVWDCINPWAVEVENGCLYHINYNYELTLYCSETESSTEEGFDFWDWIIFWD